MNKIQKMMLGVILAFAAIALAVPYARASHHGYLLVITDVMTGTRIASMYDESDDPIVNQVNCLDGIARIYKRLAEADMQDRVHMECIGE